jgi:hypothetical protein
MNIDLKPNNLTIPNYTPSSSDDNNGSVGNITFDDDFIYLKTNNNWKRIRLENF